MTNASIDGNGVGTLIATLDTDGASIVRVCADVTASNGLCVSDGTTGTDHGPVNALRDENSKPVLMAVSSVDGVTPVAVYADSNGKLLVQTT